MKLAKEVANFWRCDHVGVPHHVSAPERGVHGQLQWSTSLGWSTMLQSSAGLSDCVVESLTRMRSPIYASSSAKSYMIFMPHIGAIEGGSVVKALSLIHLRCPHRHTCKSASGHQCHGNKNNQVC